MAHYASVANVIAEEKVVTSSGPDSLDRLSQKYLDAVIAVTFEPWFRHDNIPARGSSASQLPRSTTRLL